jgi:monoamine oxidase
MQSFSERLASELPADSVKLSTPVKSIDQTTKDYMIVKAVDGRTFKAKRVLVSVPTHLYPKITFTPDLPVGKKLLSETTVMGFYAKVILVYDAPWWREAGLSGAMYTEVGPITFTRDTCVPAVKQYSLTCFVVGERGRQWSKLSSAERRKQVLDQFAMLVASVQDVPQPINVIEYEWMKHEWFLGAPSPIMPPRVLTSAAGNSIKTAHDRVHFIGTETSDIWEGYMEGAVRSGERGAKEVIEILAK